MPKESTDSTVTRFVQRYNNFSRTPNKVPVDQIENRFVVKRREFMMRRKDASIHSTSPPRLK
jgi:hypothetical protein